MNAKQTPHRRALRALRSAAGSGIAAALLLGLVAPAAQAAQAAPILAEMPSGPMTIEIHKYEQPHELGQAADGLPITDPSQLPDSDPVAVKVAPATRVPGIDLASDAGRRAAASLTMAQAAQLIVGTAAAASGTSDAEGDATLVVPGRGLYVVQETVTPAGFSGAAPFVVALPLTDPRGGGGWLTTVHVYPKNAKVGIVLHVRDREAVKLGDVVHWRSAAGIPDRPSIDAYTIRQRIAPELELSGADPFRVSLDCDGCPELAEGVHYALDRDAATGEWVFDFGRAGREALARAVAAHPGAELVIDYGTAVLAEGALHNTASLSVDGSPAVSDRAVTKWGPLAIRVHERGDPEHRIPGARFRLHLTAEDAAQGRDPIAVDGVSEWSTDDQGEIFIGGLRFSNFANGLDLQTGDPGYRPYYVIMTHVPPGYTGVEQPIALLVSSVTRPEVALVEIWRSADADADSDAGDDPQGEADAGGASDVTGGGEEPGGLSATGARLTGAGMLAALLLFGGIAVVARRRGHDAGGAGDAGVRPRA